MEKTIPIHPSAAVIVESETPIEECIALMQKRGVGSVLVVANNADQNLVGIFTERDLLKNCLELKNGEYWKRPISQVMTTGLKTIELSKIDEAPEMMLDYGVRHLPVVYTETSGKQQLVGVISMRDVFRKMSLKKIKPNTIPAKKKSHLVWVVSNDAYFKKLLIEGIPADQAKTTKVEAAEIDSAVLNSSKTDVLVIDLDGLPMKQWLSILKILNMKKQRPAVVLCFSHELIEPAGTELLDKLDSSSGFFVFTKPISISEFFYKIFP